MPKHAYDFSKEIFFYMIKCNDESVKDIYVGSTFDFSKRKAQHKSVCNNPNAKNYNLLIYQMIREHSGWDNWNMNVIERKIVIDKLEARQYEQTLIENHNAKLNSNSAVNTTTTKEYNTLYYQEHKEERKIKDNLYYQEHKEEIKIYNALYRQEHKEERKGKDALYYQEHKEERKVKDALYRQEHKEERKVKDALYYQKNKDKWKK